MKKVLFIVPSMTHLLDLSGPAQVFYEASELGAEIELNYAGLEARKSIQTAEGLIFQPLTKYSSFSMDIGDLIFIPGIHYSMWSNEDFLKNCQPFFKWLRKQSEVGIKVCSVCTGAFILGESGLLNGKKCTTHWKRQDELEQRYNGALVQRDRLFVQDKNIYTSAGISSGIDLALQLIDSLFGPKMSVDVAREMVVYLRRTESDSQLSEFLNYRNHINVSIHNAQSYISKHLHTHIKITDIAEAVNMSERNLTRQFKHIVGLTIGEYTDQLKANLAKRLLQEGHKIDTVTQKCGYSSSNQLRSLTKKVFQKLPSEIR